MFISICCLASCVGSFSASFLFHLFYYIINTCSLEYLKNCMISCCVQTSLYAAPCEMLLYLNANFPLEYFLIVYVFLLLFVVSVYLIACFLISFIMIYVLIGITKVQIIFDLCHFFQIFLCFFFCAPLGAFGNI